MTCIYTKRVDDTILNFIEAAPRDSDYDLVHKVNNVEDFILIMPAQQFYSSEMYMNNTVNETMQEASKILVVYFTQEQYNEKFYLGYKEPSLYVSFWVLLDPILASLQVLFMQMQLLADITRSPWQLPPLIGQQARVNLKTQSG